MPQHLCATCGTQFPDNSIPPASCPICEDERQYVPASGQAWTSPKKLLEGHRIEYLSHAPNLHSLFIEPSTAIGQRAFLIETPQGNVLWDCLAMIDNATIEWIKDRGGLSAIAISHPHYYTAMGAWSDAFGGIPIYLHAEDAEWVQKPHPSIQHWSGDRLEITPEITLIKCGGHFEGGTVLHWQEGDGYLFTGDILQVVADLKHVSFMRSYPNYIPLPARSVRKIGKALEDYKFDILHGAFPGKTIKQNAKAAVERSVTRYIKAIED